MSMHFLFKGSGAGMSGPIFGAEDAVLTNLC